MIVTRHIIYSIYCYYDVYVQLDEYIDCDEARSDLIFVTRRPYREEALFKLRRTHIGFRD